MGGIDMKKIKGIILSLVAIMCLSCISTSQVHAYTIYLGDYYYLESALNSNMVVDVSGGSKSNGANIQLWTKNGSDAQLFRIARNGDGYYTFINKGSNKAIDVYGAYTHSGANVNQWMQNSSSAQQWKLYNAQGYSDGYIRIMNRCGKYLDVSGAGTKDGTNIQIWDGNNTKAQVFKLVPYVQTTYKTITLGSFTTFEEWKKQMQYAEQKALGITHLTYDLNGNLINNGKMITGKKALQYKTISVTHYEYGCKKTVKLELPSKVQFKLHKHELNTQVWFDFTNLTLTQHCTCGEWSQFKWEIPYPIEEDL